MRILIIDDHPEFRKLLRHHLASEWPNAQVRELDPRLDNVQPETISVSEFDVVLLDHELGLYNGMDYLKAIKKRAPNCAVIFLTAVGDERLAVSAIKQGADDYLPKAKVTNPLLVSTIRESLRNRMPLGNQRGLLNGQKASGDSVTGIEIRGYEIVRKIASGSGSVVYLANHQLGNEEVVLKVLFGSMELSDDHEVLERFLIEYQAISAIKHPNIVQIFDVGVADDHAFISMEYLRGGSLRARLRKTGPADPNEAIDLIDRIADALRAIHEVGILHRDLKPGNVMFRDDGELCIIDFGLAKQVQISQEITQPGKIYGTPYYMSPEQGQGEDIDERSDYYSLGVILYELLTGRKPYSAGTPVALIYKHAYAAVPVLPENLSKYQLLIDKLMAKNPADRPAGPDQLSELLNHCQTL